ncbi:hypothetical protein THAPSDRAFT_268817 [Thalassiosira pseudonana CCMP1335]|uniref:RING-type E3 ubiquitin transferase n=1 Tax=Thalassiosira pseudonana TaxID=35128 RepID=B8C1Q2_THAPS|nr:hypothetical protein THAPSDRAFT_268817 [Thalassiosira pseudonana CCMP1335]EED91804.1 hypothetical protein THAPSDRAFT_268817 [Thalassiosira pseudonana CCMP1335]
MSQQHKRPPPQTKPAPNSLVALSSRIEGAYAAGGASNESASATGDESSTLYNPVSKWQEHVEVPGLTLFDIHREPRRENVDPEARVRVQLKVLSPEFHCPVCLSYIKQTRIVKECLHRFCNECIQKCLRVSPKKECPQCRVHIPSRRSLRPDPNFDNLIKSIYGNLEELEKFEEEEIMRLNRDQNMNNAYAESRKRGILHQSMHRKKRQSNQGESPRPTDTDNTTSRQSLITGLQESPLIDFVLRRHPQETVVERLKREYIRTSQDVTVKNLKMFLGQKLSYFPPSHFQILATVGGNAVILPDDTTLALIQRDICDVSAAPIVLHYRIFDI